MGGETVRNRSRGNCERRETQVKRNRENCEELFVQNENKTRNKTKNSIERSYFGGAWEVSCFGVGWEQMWRKTPTTA